MATGNVLTMPGPDRMFALRLGLVCWVLLYCGDLTGSEIRSEDGNAVVMEIRPLFKVNRHVDDVKLIHTIKNISDSTVSFSMPAMPSRSWPQLVRLFKDGKQLPQQPYGEGTSHNVIQPGEQVTVIVPLNRYYRSPETPDGEFYRSPKDPGDGLYYAYWREHIQKRGIKAHTTFTVDSKLEPAPALEIERYLKALEKSGAKDIVKKIWGKMLADPTRPEWVAFLSQLPLKYADKKYLMPLMKATRDVGVRRALADLVLKMDEDPDLIKAIYKFASTQEDIRLKRLATTASMRISKQKFLWPDDVTDEDFRNGTWKKKLKTWHEWQEELARKKRRPGAKKKKRE